MTIQNHRLIPGIIILIIIPGIFLFAQNQKNFIYNSNKQVANDTIPTSINSSTFTSSINDSIKLFAPITSHGLLNQSLKISKRDINFIEYNSTFELIAEKTNAYPLYLGTPGLMNNLSFYSTNLPRISYLYNGRKLSNFEFSSYNLEEISSEFVENFEVLLGTYSVIQTDNSIGISINFQERINNTAKPYTKLWYAQNSNDLISLDGIYSQNFLPNTNFSFGFRRQFAFGFYENSKADNWNVRVKFRWNPSDYTNISITENFNHIRNGLNEGLNLAKTSSINYFDKNAAIVNFSNFNFENFSHDITLSITHQFDKNNSSIIKSNIFYSVDDNIYKFDESQYFLLTDSILKHNYFSNYYGANLHFETKLLDYLAIKSGAEFINISSDSSKIKFSPSINTSSLSLYGLAEIYASNNLKLYGGLRYKSYLSKENFNYGGGISYTDTNIGSILLDYSQSYFFQPFLILNNIDERHQLFLLDYNFKSEDNTYSLGAYYHKIFILNNDNFETSDFYIPQNETFWGNYLTLNLKIWDEFYLNSKLLYNLNLEKNSKDYIPKLFMSLSSYYKFRAGPSIMNLGFKINLFSKINYFPYSRQFLFKIPDNDNIDYYENFSFNGITLFAIAKLGDAYIKASFENILGSDYYYVAIYPNFRYNIRLSFAWSFFN